MGSTSADQSLSAIVIMSSTIFIQMRGACAPRTRFAGLLQLSKFGSSAVRVVGKPLAWAIRCEDEQPTSRPTCRPRTGSATMR